MMAQKVDWADLLNKMYPSYTIEVQTFLDTAHISKSTDVSIEKIYEAIRNDDNVSANLKFLYHEAIYGTNKDVKLRIRNRIANFRCTLKRHPKIKNIDMLHASDYSNMGLGQMEKKLDETKKKEQVLAQGLQEEEERRKKNNGNAKDHDDCNTDSEQDNGKPVLKKAKMDENDERQDVINADVVEQQMSLQLEPGDVVYDADDNKGQDADEMPENFGLNMCTYEKNKGTKCKKLIPKYKLQKKKQLPSKPQGKAEEQFEHIMAEKKENDFEEQAKKVNHAQIQELMTSFDKQAASAISPADNEILTEIKKANDSMSKNSVEQTAYFRALGDVKNLNMEKYRKQVTDELEAKASKKDDTEADSTEAPIDDENEETMAQPNDTGNPILADADSQNLQDDAETEAYSEDTEPDETPLYPNQEEDPEVRALIWKLWFDD